MRLQTRKKNLNWWKPMRFLFKVNPLLQIMYPIIDNIFVSYNLVEHYVSSFLQKNKMIFFCERSHYVKCSNSRESLKKIVYIYCQKIVKYVIDC